MNKLHSILVIACAICGITASAQVNVGLDNWYNKEVHPKTGKSYHYLWTDSASSGYSRWGKIFTDNGGTLHTLSKPSEESLKKMDIYIIVDPDTTSESPSPNYIMPDDINTIEKWVKEGGILVLLANDGANCEFTHFNHLASRFGMTFNNVWLHKVEDPKWDMGAFTSFSNHPVFKGLKKIYMKGIASLTLTPPAFAILTENGTAFIAESRVGKGLVLAIVDPWIYNEYIDHDRLTKDFENRQAAENLTKYLIKNQCRLVND